MSWGAAEGPVMIAWRLQHEVYGDRSPADDFLAFDGDAVVGRMFAITHLTSAARWLWTLTATGAGPFDGVLCGLEEGREEAARSLSDAYDQLARWRLAGGNRAGANP